MNADDADNAGHVLTDEEYNLFLRLQEAFNQRAMGLGRGNRNDDVLAKVVFNGNNAEEFIGKFPHICSSFQVERIFYQDYGLQRPNPGPERQVWDQLDSKAYRLLEKHITGEIWSTLRDRPNMSARTIFDIFTETHLTGTVRSISTIEQEMELTRMADTATLTSHFSTMCRYFRELEIHDQALTDRQKVTKTMCKLNQEWYKLANAWVITQPDNLSFDQFRMRLIRMDADGRTFSDSTKSQAAFTASTRPQQQGQTTNQFSPFNWRTRQIQFQQQQQW
jgi:hypothetical protein